MALLLLFFPWRIPATHNLPMLSRYPPRWSLALRFLRLLTPSHPITDPPLTLGDHHAEHERGDQTFGPRGRPFVVGGQIGED